MSLRNLLIFAALSSSTVLAYDIRTEPLEQREMICNNQIAMCNNACVQKTVANSCDVNSMVWQCVCSGNRVPQATEITLPVPYFICSGSLKECNNNCAANSPGDGTCTNRCALQWNCDQLKRQNVTAPTPVAPTLPTVTKLPKDLSDSGATSLTPALLTLFSIPFLLL